MTGDEIRTTLLNVVNERAGQSSLQAGGVITEAARRLGINRDLPLEQALLTLWSDLFRNGYLAWGYNLNNIDPPFCHLTDQGRRFLQGLSRDPGNPAGYIAHLSSKSKLNAISKSYIDEALSTYNSNNFKACAVMVGAAAEAITLELRDKIVSRFDEIGTAQPADLRDWRIKRVLEAIYDLLIARKAAMPRALFDSLEAYWPAFTQQIRAARNDAGHPSSIDPITFDTVHASLLIFPELASLSHSLQDWVSSSLR